MTSSIYLIMECYNPVSVLVLISKSGQTEPSVWIMQEKLVLKALHFTQDEWESEECQPFSLLNFLPCALLSDRFLESLSWITLAVMPSFIEGEPVVAAFDGDFCDQGFH